jgi:hypothetical protein
MRGLRPYAAACLLACLLGGCSREEKPPFEPVPGAREPLSLTHGLRVSRFDFDRTFDIAPGDRIEIEADVYSVEAIRPWSGLLRDAAGVPMAAVSVGDASGAWTEDVLMEPGGWTRFRGFPPVQFLFEPDEGVRAATVERRIAEAPPGRWGVNEGGRTHWFASFAPGSGTLLDDGTAVTLVAFDEDGTPPSIRVRIERDGSAEEREVLADVSDGLVSFERNPLRGDAVVFLGGRDDRADVYRIRGGAMGEAAASLRAGYVWEDASTGMKLRLEQVLAQGVPVLREESPLLEAVLAGEDRRIRVRQGEAVRVGETTLRFIRNPDTL